MTAQAPQETLTCPHCDKEFTAEQLGSGSQQRGFKCPHCKLFVAQDRAEAAEAAEA